MRPEPIDYAKPDARPALTVVERWARIVAALVVAAVAAFLVLFVHHVHSLGPMGR